MPIADSVILTNTPLFSTLDAEECAVLGQQMDSIHLLKGQTLFSMGDAGGAMYLVLSGAIELYIPQNNGERLTLKVAEEGEMFGELALLDNQPRSAAARAVSNSYLLVLDREDLEALFKSHPEKAFEVMALLSRQVRQTTELYAGAVIRNANEVTDAIMEIESTPAERLADWLTEIASSVPFAYANAALFFVWVVLNSNIIPGLRAFDPFPFGLLTMAVSLEAIFLSLFVLISQSRSAARDKIRNDIEYEVNVRAEKEISSLARRIDEMEDAVLENLARLNGTRA